LQLYLSVSLLTNGQKLQQSVPLNPAPFHAPILSEEGEGVDLRFVCGGEAIVEQTDHVIAMLDELRMLNLAELDLKVRIEQLRLRV
jgi:hypothetical protein